MKGILAFVFSGVSVFTCFYSWWEVEELEAVETEWKTFMFLLSVVLTIPSIYQTTLMLFTFLAVAQGEEAVEKEMTIRWAYRPRCACLIARTCVVHPPPTPPRPTLIRRPIWLVLVYGLLISIVMPVALPIALVTVPFACLCGADADKMVLILVAMTDFFQTEVLIPLAYVVVFSAENPEDVFLKTVVVQVRAHRAGEQQQQQQQRET